MERVSVVRMGLRQLRNGVNALRDDPDFEWRADGKIRVIASPNSDSAEADPLSQSGMISDGDLWTAGDGFEDTSLPDVSVIVEIPPDIDIDLSHPLIGKDKSEKVKSRIMVTGVDALGWYVPFHLNNFQWGIYLSLNGVLFLSNFFLNKGAKLDRAIEMAAIAIIRHELIHFSTEYMTSQLELISGIEVYWPSRRLKDPHLGFHVREELVANAYMLRGFRYPNNKLRLRGAWDVLKDFTKSQPPGYNEGHNFVRRERFERQMQMLACEYVDTMVSSYKIPERGINYLNCYAGIDQIDLRQCPMFLVVDDCNTILSGISIKLVSCIFPIRETSQFEKKLRRMTIDIQRRWEATKVKLAKNAQIPGLDFKLWKPGTWSVRINDDVRAHLKIVDDIWNAVAIGHHKEMGHG